MRTTAALLALAVVTLAACGDDGASSATQPPGPTATLPSVPPTTAPEPSAAYDHPTGADDVVLRIAYEGGFVPVEVAFTNAPTLVVTGDGRVIQQGPMIEIYPGPLLPNLQQRTITEDGIQALLALADEHGLLADVTYESNDNIADAPFTVVTLTVDGRTFEHSAYALGLDPDGTESDPARAALAEFVNEVGDLAAVVGAGELGTEEPLETDAFLVRATALDGPPVTGDEAIEPVVVPWPEEASVRLADATECAEVPFAEVAEALTSANQFTFFTDGGVTFQVAAIAREPGRHCA